MLLQEFSDPISPKSKSLMKMENKNRYNLSVFILISFLLSIGLSLFVYWGNISASSLNFVRIGAMFIPALAVLSMYIFFKEGVENAGWPRFPIKWLIPALFIFPVAIHLIALPLVSFLNDMVIPWQPWLSL